MKKNLIKDNNKGQIALIVLTVMAMVLTLGLTLSERVITDLEVSQEEEKSAQAFSAAESGVEEALRILDQGGSVDDLDTTQIASDLGVSEVSVQSSSVGGSTEFVYPLLVDPGNSIVIWLREHDADGNIDLANGYAGASIDVCWQAGAAIEVISFYEQSGSYDISRFAFDSDNGRTGENNFDYADGGGCSGLAVSDTINLTGTPLFLVIKPFYQGTEIGVDGSSIPLPVQGYEVVSTGEVERSEEEVISRRVKVYQSWNSPSEYFYHSVFSNTGVTTN